MSNKETEIPSHFDYDEWLESVEGMTVEVTSPGENRLGPEASKLLNSPSQYSVPYCDECDEHVRLIKMGPGTAGHCPLCGRNPGALELGTRRKA